MASSGCLKKRFHNKAPDAGSSGRVQRFISFAPNAGVSLVGEAENWKTQQEPMRAQKMPER
jgi:1,4-alpha-glucan branching enzyme